MRVDFWQLSRDPAERVVALIAARSKQAGKRVLVVAEDVARREAIDEALWAEQPTAFLAHGMADEPHASRQPLILSDAAEALNDAAFIVLADGRWRAEALEFERAFLLFDETSIEAARSEWTRLGAREGLERHFYRQEGGKWIEVS